MSVFVCQSHCYWLGFQFSHTKFPFNKLHLTSSKMALRLEDLINKKEKPSQILDLSKVKIKSREDLVKYLDKAPEFYMRQEKVRLEDVRILDNEFSFKSGRRGREKVFPYSDPCPVSMSSIRLEELEAVDISWRMLTSLRPKSRVEEGTFSRLVELGKLRLATRNWEAKQFAVSANGAPGTQSNAVMASFGMHVLKTKRGGTETRIKVCDWCGLEMCTGIYCKEYPYDSYTRMLEDNEDFLKDVGGPRRGSKVKTKLKLTKFVNVKGKGAGGGRLKKKTRKKK